MNINVLNDLIDKQDGKALHYYIEKEIEKNGRSVGVQIYSHLCNMLDGLKDENKVDFTLDFLDALSGNCARSSYIGTGDYHLKK